MSTYYTLSLRVHSAVHINRINMVVVPNIFTQKYGNLHYSAAERKFKEKDLHWSHLFHTNFNISVNPVTFVRKLKILTLIQRLWFKEEKLHIWCKFYLTQHDVGWEMVDELVSWRNPPLASSTQWLPQYKKVLGIIR